MTGPYQYPQDLADHLRRLWPPDLPPEPLCAHWPQLLAVAYQASMRREEERPVRLRLLLASAADLARAEQREELHLLRFARDRPFHAEELRRLAAAAPFEASLLCVAPDGDGALRLWALAWSGAGWLAPAFGGRRRSTFCSSRTIVHIAGAGRLRVHAGEHFVASLEGGALVTTATDVFASVWMPALFADVRAELVDAHEHARGQAAAIHESLIRSISQQMIKRTLWLLRASHHGGLLLFAEADEIDALLAGPLRAKYLFQADEARGRYRVLLRRIIDALARSASAPVTERDFFQSSGELSEVEAAIFELSRLIASLAAVDGAVLLSKRFELIGFGVEVLGDRAPPPRIRRALDPEGTELVDEPEESVGTRHRAAYRFGQTHPRGLAIVVSQDGSIRFVTCIDGAVTYFEQQLAG